MSTVETPQVKQTVKHNGDALGTGRRKTSVARVRVRAGSGKITVNSRAFEEFFVREQDRNAVMAPLAQTDRVGSVDVSINVHGGGITGQAGACKLGLARALKIYDSGLEEALRQGHLLTRDSRMKERKHYGLRGARRGTQFSKR
ncbi:MAG TPA: 30S ribosomal protein S9 [Pirellulales bacterium]|nr:30S ribosomal protein S9 [Pirellulales bacterium]